MSAQRAGGGGRSFVHMQGAAFVAVDAHTKNALGALGKVAATVATGAKYCAPTNVALSPFFPPPKKKL